MFVEIKEGHKTYDYCKSFTDLWDLELDRAEGLINDWTTQEPNEIKLKNDIELVSCLLIDNLLPDSARIALGNLLLETYHEARRKKLHIDSLGLRQLKPRRGRKRKDKTHEVDLYLAIHHHRFEGSANQLKEMAYKEVAHEHNVAAVTIRREYEKKKKSRLRKRTGKIPNNFPVETP